MTGPPALPMPPVPPGPAAPSVVVLGAGGYLGSVVTALLAARPIRLRAVGRRPAPVSTPASAPAPAQIDVVTADLTDRSQLAAAVTGADAVVHLVKQGGSWRRAGEDPVASARVNVGVMQALVEVLGAQPEPGPAPLVVFAATTSQVGHPPGRLLDGSEPDEPETEYDRQKLAAEQTLLAASAKGQVRGVSLRLATAFGQSHLSPAPDPGFVTGMVRRALAGQPLTMWNDGSVLRDLTYVDDVAAAFLAALDRPDDLVGRHWLVGSGRPDRLDDVFHTVAAAVAARTGRPPVPVLSVEPPPEAQATDFWSVRLDPTPFRSVTGWAPRVSLSEGVDRTVAALVAGRGRDHADLVDTSSNRSTR